MSAVLDVLVVGAGLSGLQAALDVHEAGGSVLVLEARDRVGGKTWSQPRPDGKGIQEIGAGWVNDTNQSHVWAYCKQFGLTPIVQNITGLVASEDETGNSSAFPYGEVPKLGQADEDDIVQFRTKVEKASLDPETFKQPNRLALDKINLDEWTRKNGGGKRALQTARLWTRGCLGCEPGEVSALAFLEMARGGLGIINLRHDGKHGAQNLRLQEGTQSISKGMAKLLPQESVQLNSPVQSIMRHSPKLYSVTTADNHVVKARKVIISIPSPAYKHISFDPPLSSQRQLYNSAARYGCYVKFIAMFKTPFWRQKGFCGLAQSFRGPINHCRDTSADSQENYALTCFICAGSGREWLALNQEERVETALRQLGSLLQVGYDAVRAEYIGNITSPWMEDKWAGWGCPFASTAPGATGHLDDGLLVNEKDEGLYFVGTEMTNEWRGYMEGALRSGKRGAAQAMEDLRSQAAQL